MRTNKNNNPHEVWTLRGNAVCQENGQIRKLVLRATENRQPEDHSRKFSASPSFGIPSPPQRLSVSRGIAALCRPIGEGWLPYHPGA